MNTLQKLNVLCITIGLIIGFNNSIQLIEMGAPVWKYILYTLPYPILASLAYIARAKLRYAHYACFFLVIMLLTMATGDQNNLSPALLFCYSVYLFRNKWIAFWGAVGFLVALIVKSYLSKFTGPQTINYLTGSLFIVAVFYVLFIKLPIKMTFEDRRTVSIVKMLIDGLTYKEIGSRLDMEESAVSKHLERARKRSGLKSNYGLLKMLYDSGQID